MRSLRELNDDVHQGLALDSESPGSISDQLNQKLEVGPGHQDFS